jgi:hypothetical protein
VTGGMKGKEREEKTGKRKAEQEVVKGRYKGKY